MAEWEVIYFDFNHPFYGRGEAVRLLLRAAKTEFKDTRFPLSDLGKWKESGELPFGSIPIVKHKGNTIAQMVAINYYIGKELGLAPKTVLDDTFALSIVAAGEDIFNKIIQGVFHVPDDQKAAKKEENMKAFALSAKQFEKLLTQREGGDQFFVGKDLTFADIHAWHVWNHVGLYVGQSPDQFLKETPKLLAWFNRVAALPQLKDYIASRK